uniref:Uncharacterized protein n=1 Tax=Macrostomum lignano TaxID=282301 RepID=A0A1I8JID4_9PLAT
MPKRQECALTISSEHSDLAAASVIWFTCCSQAAAAAAAAAAAIRAGSQSICEFSGGSEENPSGTGLKRKRRSVLASILISPLHPSFGSLAAHKPQQQQQQQQPLSVQAVSLFVNFLVDLKKTHSEVSNASDMPKRQECALTISSEHSDLAAASVIWFTCCSQAAAAAAAAAAIRAGTSILISPLHPSFGSLAAHKPQQQQQQPLSVQAVSLFVNFLVDLKKTRPAQD